MKDVYSMLSCPVCKSPLCADDRGKALLCTNSASPRTHSFDKAASGYVNLSVGQSAKAGGDSKEMARARNRFLSRGYYDPVADALSTAVQKYTPGTAAVDAGCGTGLYSMKIAEALDAVIGFDVSKSAVEIAAKSAARVDISPKKLLFAVAGIFDMPVADGACDAVVSMFAPCAEQEFTRVLSGEGIVVCGAAGENHLMGLKSVLYDKPYKNSVRADLPRHMTLCEKIPVHYTVEIKSAEAVQELFAMTPYYFNTPRESAEKLGGVDRLVTEIEVDIFVYRNKA